MDLEEVGLREKAEGIFSKDVKSSKSEGMEYIFPSDHVKQWREELLSNRLDGVYDEPALMLHYLQFMALQSLGEGGGASEIETKLVALYLCGLGIYLPLLRELDESCRKSDKQMEIVIQFITYILECLSVVLAKRNLSWWVAPFNYSAFQRLMPLSRDEAMVILGPDGKYVDLHGADVMKYYYLGGDTSGHPFTFDGAVEYMRITRSSILLWHLEQMGRFVRCALMFFYLLMGLKLFHAMGTCTNIYRFYWRSTWSNIDGECCMI